MAHPAARINHGVEMLCQGRVGDSFLSFRQTLADMANEPLQFVDALPVAVRRIEPVPVSSNVFHDATGISSTVYQRAFCVSESESDTSILSLTLLYNTALVYHSRAMWNGRNTHMRKALRLYQNVYESVADTREDLREKALIVMASINNASQLHTQMVNHIEAMECFARLRTIIELVQQFRIVPDDFQFFLIAVTVENDQHDGRLFSAPSA